MSLLSYCTLIHNTKRPVPFLFQDSPFNKGVSAIGSVTRNILLKLAVQLYVNILKENEG